jgi:hypothetical protein
LFSLWQVKDKRQRERSLVHNPEKSADVDVQTIGTNEKHFGGHVNVEAETSSRVGSVQKRSGYSVGQQNS